MKLGFILPILSLGQKADESNCDKKCKAQINKQFRKGTTNLAWKLLFDSGDSDMNKVISPLSIISSFYMLGAGAGGETQAAILDALVDMASVDDANVAEQVNNEDFFARFFEMESFLSNESNQYTLDIANGVFAKENMLEPTYETALRNYFIKDAVKEVDFAADSNATDTINEWIADRTHGKIPKMYEEPIDPNTLIMLVSSLYFKGSWANKFTPMSDVRDEHERVSACWPKDFDNTEVCNEDVEFMTVSDSGRFGAFDDMDFIELPMKETEQPITVNNRRFTNKMTFQIWLPRNEDIRDPEVDAKFKKSILSHVSSARSMQGIHRQQKIKLTMPKFSIDFDQDVKDLMAKNGLDVLFSNDKDLSPMVGADNNDLVEISEVKHKVAFDLDEEGIEGAATTVHQISFRSMQTPKPVTVTRPFYFALVSHCYDQDGTQSSKKGCPYTNIPVFIGKVAEPHVRQ